MATVIHHNFVGKTYEDVDAQIHAITGVPATMKWTDLDQRPFRGNVPKESEGYVFQAIRFLTQNKTLEEVRMDSCGFRSEKFFGNMFRTDKLLHGYQHNKTVVFDTSTYGNGTHENNLAMFQILAKAFQGKVVEIHSVRKDNHEGASSGRPFARDHVALLVVRPGPPGDNTS
jgi:hypothetical protein